jgi:hypothetical protein
MKLFIFFLGILFSLTLVYAENSNQFDKTIDSLKAIKIDYENQKGVLEAKIVEIDKLIETLHENKIGATLKSTDYQYPAHVKANHSLLSEGTYASPKILTFSNEDTVGLENFDGVIFYKVNYKGKIGYLSNIDLVQDSKFTEWNKSLKSSYDKEKGISKKPTTMTPSATTPQATSSDQTIHTGPRGGKYYINSSGKKVYVSKKRK